MLWPRRAGKYVLKNNLTLTWIYRVFVLLGQGVGNTDSCTSGLLHGKSLTTSSELVIGSQCTAEGSRQGGRRRSTRKRVGDQVAITESKQTKRRGVGKNNILKHII